MFFDFVLFWRLGCLVVFLIGLEAACALVYSGVGLLFGWAGDLLEGLLCLCRPPYGFHVLFIFLHVILGAPAGWGHNRVGKKAPRGIGGFVLVGFGCEGTLMVCLPCNSGLYVWIDVCVPPT